MELIFMFFFMGLSQSYAHGHEISGLTHVDPNIVFCFFFNFFQFHHSILSYFIVELHGLI